MIDIGRLEEAIKFFDDENKRGKEYWDEAVKHSEIIIGVSKAFLLCTSEMPKQGKCREMFKETCGNTMGLCSECYRNKAIEECALVTTRLLAEKDAKIVEIKNDYEKCIHTVITKKDAEIAELKKQMTKTTHYRYGGNLEFTTDRNQKGLKSKLSDERKD